MVEDYRSLFWAAIGSHSLALKLTCIELAVADFMPVMRHLHHWQVSH
jgi:hypothetical protein